MSSDDNVLSPGNWTQASFGKESLYSEDESEEGSEFEDSDAEEYDAEGSETEEYDTEKSEEAEEYDAEISEARGEMMEFREHQKQQQVCHVLRFDHFESLPVGA